MRYFWIYIVLIFVSCNQNDKKTKSNLGDRLIFEVKIMVPLSDELELFYNSRYDPNFTSDKSIKKNIKGSSDVQIVSFALNNNEYPTRLRLDLGQNPKQTKIKIQKMALKYNDASHVFSKEEIKRYFKPNQNVVFNFNTLEAKFNHKLIPYDPYLESFNLSKFINALILN